MMAQDRASVVTWWTRACLTMLFVLHSVNAQSVGSDISSAVRGAASDVANAVGLGPGGAPAPGPTAESPLVGGGSYVALGDSYSAGIGAGDIEGKYYPGCQQSPSAAWPTLLAQELGVSSQFNLSACSGYTSVDILRNETGALSAATTLVTLTAGGDDADVSATLAECVEPKIGSFGDCSAAVNASLKNITNLGGSLDALYQRIRQLAPNARVFAANYPDIVPDHDCQVDSDLSSSDIDGLKSLINPLSDQIQAAVSRAGSGFYFVDVRPVWVGHALFQSHLREQWLAQRYG
ncbi:hypothetical protein WJX73_004554 [Symbiochloris irregularis]|uniref:SGNH hydrolase-type esterase domain-containing protein n=1 Tax=Symbiochloris irregularis TaxID=706552 RepID=A0AAW1NYF1_9CHLO